MADIILNGEKLEAVTMKLETRQGCTLAPLLLNILLKTLGGAIRQEKKTERLQIGKEIKLSLFLKYILYYRNSIYSTRKLPEMINKFNNVAGLSLINSVIYKQ